jgi:hypothetical protein
MATDSLVVRKVYAESIGTTTFTYGAVVQKVYAESIVTQTFPYQSTVSKVYAEIIAGVVAAPVITRRRMVTAQVA